MEEATEQYMMTTANFCDTRLPTTRSRTLTYTRTSYITFITHVHSCPRQLGKCHHSHNSNDSTMNRYLPMTGMSTSSRCGASLLFKKKRFLFCFVFCLKPVLVFCSCVTFVWYQGSEWNASNFKEMQEKG